jgi:hypothetical protein
MDVFAETLLEEGRAVLSTHRNVAVLICMHAVLLRVAYR